jgi:hypothetical protein
MSPSIAARRLCSLTTAELFVLCSLRLVGRAVREGREIDEPCREGFEIARLTLRHAEHLAAAVSAMNDAARGPLDLHDVRCAEVSGDEERVLQVLLLLQHENEFGARRVLWKLLPPAAVRIVLAHLDALAIGMVRAGLLLPQQPYALRPCPAEALAARRLGAATGQDVAQNVWLN